MPEGSQASSCPVGSGSSTTAVGASVQVMRSSSCEAPRPASSSMLQDFPGQRSCGAYTRLPPQSPVSAVRPMAPLAATPKPVNRARTLSPNLSPLAAEPARATSPQRGPMALSPRPLGRSSCRVTLRGGGGAATSALLAAATPAPPAVAASSSTDVCSSKGTAGADAAPKSELLSRQGTETTLTEIVNRQHELQGTVERLCGQVGQVALGLREWQSSREQQPHQQKQQQQRQLQRVPIGSALNGGETSCVSSAQGCQLLSSTTRTSPEFTDFPSYETASTIHGEPSDSFRHSLVGQGQTSAAPEVCSPMPGSEEEQQTQHPRLLRQVVESLQQQNHRLEAKNSSLEERNKSLEEAMYELLQRVGSLEERISAAPGVRRGATGACSTSVTRAHSAPSTEPGTPVQFRSDIDQSMVLGPPWAHSARQRQS